MKATPASPAELAQPWFGVSGWVSELRVWASTVEEAVKNKDNEQGDESPDLLVDDTVAVGKHYGVYGE